MSYVKTCNPGQIRMDLPTANYVYELPLLSFADIHGSMNLSLIFNQKMKEDEANPFLLTAGYKLNVQKMLEIENNIPVATNIATAEALIHSLERGDLDWRDIVNPKA